MKPLGQLWMLAFLAILPSWAYAQGMDSKEAPSPEVAAESLVRLLQAQVPGSKPNKQTVSIGGFEVETDSESYKVEFGSLGRQAIEEANGEYRVTLYGQDDEVDFVYVSDQEGTADEFMHAVDALARHSFLAKAEAQVAEAQNAVTQPLSAPPSRRVSYEALYTGNARNINNVEVGMTIDQVVMIMGTDTSAVRDGPLTNPWKTESLGEMEIHHYLTRKNPPFTPILENQATPIIFESGRVVSVGRSYIKSARRNANSGGTTTTPQGSKSVEARLERLKAL